MLAHVLSAGLVGIGARVVEVQVDIGLGLPQLAIVGLPETVVRESKERVRSAIRNCGFDYPLRRITINLAPADMKKEGAAYDLPIAAGILAAAGTLDAGRLGGCLLAGELALDGRLAPIRGALPLAAAARRYGASALILPAANAAEAALVDGLAVFGAATLADAVGHLGGTRPLAAATVDHAALLGSHAGYDVDLGDVRGQETARRALEVAAGGGHNLLFIGPPGSGKTMLARRLPTILPALALPEALEVTAIHSVAGLLDGRPLLARRPFRAPHHTISYAGLVGGGLQPRPGEATLAHHGVLFLDELPEFPRQALEALREPLEDARLTVARAAGAVTFPTEFALVAAMNPCMCGHYGSQQRACTCVAPAIARYRARVSGPLLDRIDLHVEVPGVPYHRLAERAPGEPSERVRARVEAARAAQQARFAERSVATNARMTAADLRRHCTLDAAGERLLAAAAVKLGLSARAYTRVLKVARTIADLAGADGITTAHVAEAIQYRSLDRAVA